MVQRNLLADTPNTCRVTERVAPSHFPWNSTSSFGNDSDHCERPTKRRRISSYGRDERVVVDEFPSWPSSLTPTSQFMIPMASHALRNPSSQSLVDPQSNRGSQKGLYFHFSGNYHLYPIDQQTSVDMWLSQDLLVPNYEALYRVLSGSHSTSVSKPVAKCHIPDAAKTGSCGGSLVAINIHDPLSAKHTHTINVTQIIPVGSLSFTLDELAGDLDTPLSAPLPVLEGSPGISASLQVDGTTGLLPDIVDSFGEFKMRRVWTRAVDDVSEAMELYQGYFTLNVFYGEEYEVRDCIPLASHRQAFWGIRLHRGSEMESG
ncbi:hypothetical protein PM082_010584 [Marasmius tenuissimus]|nr:hypothetical protein PM082_010584 [Marasmius tenuissimus]